MGQGGIQRCLSSVWIVYISSHILRIIVIIFWMWLLQSSCIEELGWWWTTLVVNYKVSRSKNSYQNRLNCDCYWYTCIFTVKSKFIQTYSQKSSTRICHTIFKESWLIHQDTIAITNIILSHSQLFYSSSDLYIPWIVWQDPMQIFFESCPDFSISIQLRYFLAYFFDIVS